MAVCDNLASGHRYSESRISIDREENVLRGKVGVLEGFTSNQQRQQTVHETVANQIQSAATRI